MAASRWLIAAALAVGCAQGRLSVPLKVPPPPPYEDLPPDDDSHDGLAPLIPQRPPPRSIVLARLSAALALARRKPLASAAAVLTAAAVREHVRVTRAKRKALQRFRVLASQPQPTYGITIVTTAALPWKTGTAVNALLRASHLAAAGHRVALCVPWIHPFEQALIFPGGETYTTPEAQEEVMRTWLASRAGAKAPFEIRWYPARYDLVRGSILPLGDTTRWAAGWGDCARNGARTETAAVDRNIGGTGGDGGPGIADGLCVLEEPEHLNWYHGGRNWREAYPLVVGVAHTNYVSYAAMYQPENVWVIRFINALVVRAYTDSTLKLSDSLQRLTRAAVVNVHGVRSEFTDMGRARAAAADPDAGVDRSKESGAAVGEGKGGGKEKEQAAAGSGGLHTEGKGGGVAAHTEGAESERGAHTEGGDGGVAHTAGAYFIGKLLWAKGHGLLIEYLQGGEDAERGGGAGGGEGAAAGNAGGGPSGADTAKGAGSPATGGGASCTDTFGGTAGPDTGGEPRPAGRATPVDIFGEGEDDEAVRAAAARAGVALRFRGPRDHAHPDLYKYKVFVNPSRTEVLSITTAEALAVNPATLPPQVLSTTTAEALAMGKIVVIERHPSNDFFYSFPNTLTYSTPQEFREALGKALSSTPTPLSEADAHALTWQGGTERFLSAVAAAARAARPPTLPDQAAVLAHRLLTGWKGYFGDFVKRVCDSGPISKQRWLHRDQKYTRCRDVTVIVDKSIAVYPPDTDTRWSERYGGGGAGRPNASWTSRLPLVGHFARTKRT